MRSKFVFSFLVIAFITITTSGANVAPPSELICGKWASAENNLVVQVYLQGNKFLAKIVWFKGDHPMDCCQDIHNPDPTLRSRKILGLSVLKDMNYMPETNSWENGTIYDSLHGRDWNASAYIDKDGLLRVKGYWHFKFIGRTLTFKRVQGA
jgi:uncharacterized protein (DUF2147 family)